MTCIPQEKEMSSRSKSPVYGGRKLLIYCFPSFELRYQPMQGSRKRNDMHTIFFMKKTVRIWVRHIRLWFTNVCIIRLDIYLQEPPEVLECQSIQRIIREGSFHSVNGPNFVHSHTSSAMSILAMIIKRIKILSLRERVIMISVVFLVGTSTPSFV